jgi:hydrogenase 3 maturation protease
MKVLVLAVGNSMNGDDGISAYIVEHINRKLAEINEKQKSGAFKESSEEILTIDCGTTPENYTSVIRTQQPDKLVLVDAAEMGLSPGSYRIIMPERMGVMTMSTHNMPLSLFVSYISQFCSEVLLLGIQPKLMDFNTALSPELRRSGEELAILIASGRLDQIEQFS